MAEDQSPTEAPTLAGAHERALEMFDQGADGGDAGEGPEEYAPAIVPEGAVEEGAEEDLEAPAETQPPPAAQDDDPIEEWEIGPEKLKLKRSDAKFLVKFGVEAYQEAQRRLRETPDPRGTATPEQATKPKPPPPLPPDGGKAPESPELKALRETVEALKADSESRAQREEEAAARERAQGYVREAEQAIAKVEFFKDLDPEEAKLTKAMVMVLQNQGNLSAEDAAKKLAGFHEKRITSKNQNYMKSKLDQAREKPAASGATHPAPPEKITGKDLESGRTLKRALDMLRTS